MIIFKDDVLLLDSDSYKLNLAVKFEDYRSSSEKLVKTDGISFNDSYVYHTGSFQGYSTKIELFVRNIKFREVEKAMISGNRISLEPNRYREYYIDGEIKYDYLGEYIKMEIPIYLNAGRYSTTTFNKQIPRTLTTVINNEGNIPAEPIYTIRGNGNLNFTVNGVLNKLVSANGGYVIDCRSKRQNVYDLNGNPKNITSEYLGIFPRLNPGNNTIQLLDGTSLEIKTNWRWR